MNVIIEMHKFCLKSVSAVFVHLIISTSDPGLNIAVVHDYSLTHDV